MKLKVKKIISLLLLVLILCTTIQINTFAAFITDINSNARFGVISGSLSKAKHELHYATYDGSTYIVFCTQWRITSPNGSEYTYNGDFIPQYKENRPEYARLAEMIYWGYTMKYGIGLPTTDAAYSAACATQQYVWEYIHNNIDSSFSYPSRDSWTSTYMSSSKYATWLSEAEGYYNQYHSKVSFGGITTKVAIGESMRVTDLNGVLKDYATFSYNIDGVTFSHTQGSNDLCISANSDCNTNRTSFNSANYGIYQLMPNGASYSRNTMSNFVYFHFTNGSIQDLIFSNYVDPSTFNITVEVESGKIVLNKTDSNGTALAGCVFKLYSDEGCTQEVATGTSSSNGNISFEKLKPGTYYIKEVSVPNGYLIDNTIKRVDVRSGETTEVSFKNNEPTGEIRIQKVNENGDKIKDTEFTVTAGETIKNVSGSKTYYTKGQVVKVITTNHDGIAYIDNLPMGKYIVKESKAVKGYLLNEETFTANLEYKNSTTPVVELEIKGIVNNEPRGEITIIKKDSETGSVHQGDATLENAVYKVYAAEDIYNVAKSKKFYSQGDLVATRTTNDKGEMLKITDLPLGHYRVKEEVASNGYLLDRKEYDVKLTYNDSSTKIISIVVTSNEDVKKQQIHIYKSGIKVQSGLVDGLEGAEFTIKLNSDVENAYSKGYTYSEVWNGIDEYGNKVSVNKNRVQEAQKIAPTYEAITTDEDGNAYTQSKLPFGKYIVKETVTPKDFESAADFTFTITKDESEIEEVAQKVKHLVVNNEQLETYLKIIKKDLMTDKTVTLSSSTFQIKATKDILDRGTGKIIYKKGDIIKQKVGNTTYTSFTTNADNIVVPEGSYNSNNDDKGSVVTPLLLPVGSYEITEIRVPEGFLQLESPVTFKIEGIRDYEKDQDGDYIEEIILKNEQPTGTLIIDKYVAIREEIDTSLIDISDLSGIEFTLVAKENIIDMADGSIIYEKGKEVKKVNLNKDGTLQITKLPLGIYELYESKTLNGLVINSTRYEVKFTQEDLVTKIYENTVEVINNTTIVEFSKQSITGDTELVGAKLTVIDENGNIIDTWISTENTHKIECLVVGKTYTLIEEIAPEGFVKATEIKFTIEDTAEIQKVKMIDKIVEMTKSDIAGEEIEGAELKVYNKDGEIVDEWVSGNEPHRIKKLKEGETYILHEEYAPDGFTISTDIEFTVGLEKETQKIEMIDKIVEMSKIDVSGKEIEGATIVVTNKRTKNIVDKWVSENVPHIIKGLIEGETYIIHEEIAAEGYVKATDIEFTVGLEKETQKIEMVDKVVLISKTDLVTGEELLGAKLQVTDKDGNVVDEWISGNEQHHVSGLEEGNEYTLTEITSPYGYELAESITFKVTEDKETQLIEMKDMPILANIKVVKMDSDTGEIIKSKFKFAIYEDQECTKLIKEVESNIENGTVEFEDLRFGTFFIKEIEAPSGYYLSEEIAKVDINEDGVFINGKKIEEKDEAYSFNFYDTLIPTIQTGNEVNNILLISLMVISLIGITLGIVVMKKKQY